MSALGDRYLSLFRVSGVDACVRCVFFAFVLDVCYWRMLLVSVIGGGSCCMSLTAALRA